MFVIQLRFPVLDLPLAGGRESHPGNRRTFAADLRASSTVRVPSLSHPAKAKPSVRHERAPVRPQQEIFSDASERPFAQSAVPIGASDDDIGCLIACNCV
jgi:hypothetical protein